MANSADPDQLASSEANWSGSTLFAKAGYIWVQHDKGYTFCHTHPAKRDSSRSVDSHGAKAFFLVYSQDRV